jgi:hypothetical protein
VTRVGDAGGDAHPAVRVFVFFLVGSETIHSGFKKT